MNQRCSHVDEVGTQLDIQRRRLRHVLHVLRSDLGDGNVVYVDLIPANEIQQQVERTFVRFKLEIERLRRHYLTKVANAFNRDAPETPSGKLGFFLLRFPFLAFQRERDVHRLVLRIRGDGAFRSAQIVHNLVLGQSGEKVIRIFGVERLAPFQSPELLNVGLRLDVQALRW